jgi:hypothetical protein
MPVQCNQFPLTNLPMRLPECNELDIETEAQPHITQALVFYESVLIPTPLFFPIGAGVFNEILDVRLVWERPPILFPFTLCAWPPIPLGHRRHSDISRAASKLLIENYVRRALQNVPRVLDQILLRINEVCNPQERSEDTPTSSVCAEARRIVSEAHKISPINLDVTTVEASEGDLLIHWDTPTKGIVLICPKNGGAPSLYRETLEGVRPTDSELLSNASSTSLSEALAWVQSVTP